MYSKCASEKSAEQQRRLETALAELMGKQLFETISISELCRVTGLSRKTFYRLYDTKADLVYAMIDHALLDAATYIPDASVAPGGVHKFLAYWKSRQDLLDALQNNRASALLSQQAVIHVMTEAPELMRSFGAEDRAHGRELMVFYISAIFALVLDWHSRGFDRSIDDLSRTIMELLTTPPIKMSPDFNLYE